MNDASFDTLSRRASLLTLGSVGLAGLADPFTGTAKKKSKKNNKSDAFKLCKRQAAVWTDLVRDTCEADPTTPGCDFALTCAKPLARCDFNGFLTCLVTGL